MQKIKEFFQRNYSRRAKIISGVLVVVISIVIIFGWHRISVFAQSVIDGFTDTSKIAATWQTYVDTTNHNVTLAQKSCDNGVWDCADNNVCANGMGDGAYIIVQKVSTASLAWKTTQTECSQPQCEQDGSQNGDNLRKDNTIDFSAYPARNYCKSIGGRLPTTGELGCMYTNRVTFGNNFGTSYYWSSAEEGGGRALFWMFSSNTLGSGVNTYTGALVRCVRGW
ncbi:MAG: hypothetical protein RBS77_04235 [Candidatus Moranbacteria bacterium]|jgi:hypothetical protein|nr:hypothetical protein [Candidatus Moranbacteria bacterium]